MFVVILGIGNHASLLTRQVNAEPIAEAHRHHVVLPTREGLGIRAILALVHDHLIESPAKITVARGLNSIRERRGRSMTVTTHTRPTVNETVITGIGSLRRNDTFL